MKTNLKLAVGAAALVGAVALSAVSASAAVVCNRANECWHVKSHYSYKPAWGITVHPSTWRWGANDHYVWREHAGRGYWRDGKWHRF